MRGIWMRLLGCTVVVVCAAFLLALPATASPLNWTTYPSNISVSQSMTDGFPVSEPDGGWTGTDEQGPIKVHEQVQNGDLDIDLSGTGQGGTAWNMEVGGKPWLWARPGLHPTERIPTAPNQMSMDINWGAAGCGSQAPGTVDLLDIRYAPDGRVTRLWLRYSFTCDTPGALVTGEVRFGYPEVPAEASPTSGVFQNTPPGGTSPAVAVLVRRPAGATVGAPRFVGGNAGSFVMLAETCTGATSGPACMVRVALTPVGSGFRRSTLEVPVGPTVVKVPLEGLSLPGTYRHVFTSDPQSVASGNSGDLTPANTTTFQAGLGQGRDSNETMYGQSLQDGVGPEVDVWAPANEKLRAGTFSTAEPAVYGVAYLKAAYWHGTSGITCPTGNDQATWTIAQLVRGPAVQPAYDLTYDQWCSNSPDAHVRGHFQYGARADVTNPAGAGRLYIRDGVLHWSVAPDVAHSVVRVRAGGSGIPSLTNGDLICSTAGTSCHIPARYARGSLALTVFNLDTTGNVSPTATYIRRGPTTVTINKSTGTLTGRVTDAVRGYRLSGRTVALQSRKAGGKWATLRSTTTDGGGRYKFAISPSSPRQFRVDAKPSLPYLSKVSRTVTAG